MTPSGLNVHWPGRNTFVAFWYVDDMMVGTGGSEPATRGEYRGVGGICDSRGLGEWVRVWAGAVSGLAVRDDVEEVGLFRRICNRVRSTSWG